MKLVLDDYNLDEAAGLVTSAGEQTFRYVVTPNVDHVIRYYDDARFREFYSQADFVFNDSRLFTRILKAARGLQPRVCPGSDLTAKLFSIVRPDDHILVIGSRTEQVNGLIMTYGLRNLDHYSPPMGFARSPAEVERALAFVESHSPFRYCFLAVGSPQQELLAYELKRRGRARGVGLCVGASIDFLSGEQKRAPQWMQKLSLEWLYRLLQDPGRLAKRYLVRGPRIFALLPKIDFELRRLTGADAGRSSPART